MPPSGISVWEGKLKLCVIQEQKSACYSSYLSSLWAYMYSELWAFNTMIPFVFGEIYGAVMVILVWQEEMHKGEEEGWWKSTRRIFLKVFQDTGVLRISGFIKFWKFRVFFVFNSTPEEKFLRWYFLQDSCFPYYFFGGKQKHSSEFPVQGKRTRGCTPACSDFLCQCWLYSVLLFSQLDGRNPSNSRYISFPQGLLNCFTYSQNGNIWPKCYCGDKWKEICMDTWSQDKKMGGILCMQPLFWPSGLKTLFLVWGLP